MNFKQTDTITKLIQSYFKIIRVDIATGLFIPVVIPDDEWTALQDADAKTISDYIEWFTTSEFIHPDDREALKGFDVMRQGFIIYRRKVNSNFRFVLLRTVKTVNPEEVVIYIEDVHEIYLNQYENIVDRLGTVDNMTGLYNRTAFERDRRNTKCYTVGILFADINGLKHTNDTKGHSAGDELIISFANLLSSNFNNYKCYHISGDEFIVVSYDKIRGFLRDALTFYKTLWSANTVPIASVGYSAGLIEEFTSILKDAEVNMYDDKNLFYTKFPELKRGG